MPYMIDITPQDIERAYLAVKFAQQVRAFHARRTEKGSGQREIDIKLALERIKETMEPIRRYRSSSQYLPDNPNTAKKLEAARLASEALQTERRKLWKMTKKPKRKKVKHA